VYDVVAFADRHHDQPVALGDLPEPLRQRMATMSTLSHVGTMIRPSEVLDGSTFGAVRNASPSQFAFQRASRLVNSEADIVAGETHYLSHNIMQGLITAADSADDEPLFPTDLPCPHGLLVLEYPLIIDDLDPETGAIVPGLSMPIRAIGWSEQDIYATSGAEVMAKSKGVLYALYTDAEAMNGIYFPALRDLFPDDWRLSEPVAPGRTLLVDVSGWSYGRTWSRAGDGLPRDQFGVGDMDGKIHDTVARIRRLLLTYFRMCWQRILVPTIHHPTRADWKRARRIAGPMPEPGYLKVIRLRRLVEAEERGETGQTEAMERDFAWMVRAHPRRQWYPSLGPARLEDGSFNHDAHRLIWIEPHVKGNPDGPLVIGHSVTAMVR
jgi:hypothetical protein